MNRPAMCGWVGAACLGSAASAGVISFENFNYPSEQYLWINGSAGVTNTVDADGAGGDVLRLTSFEDEAGSAWYLDTVNVSRGFETRFTYNVDGGGFGAEGLAFVIQAAGERSLGQGGRHLGMRGFGAGAYVAFSWFGFGSVSIGAAEYDMNVAVHSLNHASFDWRGRHDVRIVYTPGSMAVYLDGAQDGSPSLVAPLDLTNFNGVDLTMSGGLAYVGFTGATGSQSAGYQDIENWTLTPAPGGAGALAAGLGLVARRRRR